MNFKELGATGVAIPEIGLGTWSYFGGIEPLRAGLDAGALFIDTAESYGSEEVVGQAIREMRDQVFLATKVSPGHYRYNDVLRAAEGSLRRLNVDCIDLYQLHAPNLLVPLAETLAAMEKLVDDGKVRFIGVSNFSARGLKRAQHLLRKHQIAANQVRYNLVDRSIEAGLLAHCQAHKITVIAYTPLERGIPRLLAADTRGILNSLAAELSKSPAQIALNWCLCQERVVAIPKSNSTTHTVENCAASGWRLTSEQVRLLDERIPFRRRSQLEILARFYMPRRIGGLLRRLLGKA